MIPVSITPFKAVDKAYYKIKPHRSDFDNFKTQLSKLISNINEKESEEHNKNLIRDFLKNTFFKDYFINTKNHTDLAVYLGKTAQSKIGVLIETKSPINKYDMITKDNLNAKAMHEVILYYLRERIEEHNDDIKHIIITNAFEWFIFNATEFEKLFYKNKELINDYKNWNADKKVSSSTDHFYKEIAKKYIDEIDKEIEFISFDIREYEKILIIAKNEEEKKLIPLFKVFSAPHLLKESFLNDSNSLNKQFYQELLHIIGLEETKAGNKKIIGRREPEKRESGSLLENTVRILVNDDIINTIDNLDKYGENKEQQLFNIALELNITWINRLLFLKLLEAQLINYHKGDISYKFLDPNIITEFDDLYELFHEVLAKKIDERSQDTIEKFKKIPYLNSSLFEQSDLEKKTIKINSLKNRFSISIFKQSVLKGDYNIPPEKLHTLEYFLLFLDAFDFTSDSTGEVQEEKKNLINASVLGRIFEKINGYKEGSYFTPGFITMYMAKETLRRAVVQKFNDVKGWECSSFEDLKEKKIDIKEANEIINSIKICDPAVGSGHFLVSALNELLAIKSELDILCYRDGTRIKYYKVEVANDELSVYDEEAGEIFEYSVNDKGEPPEEKQKLQEALFHEKETIIENCLFGVDINPNSVNICRLRLWIELLKNAYYSITVSTFPPHLNKERGRGEVENFELITLPNIDINIKEGNSLISRFDLTDDYSKMPITVMNDMKFATQKYKDQVLIYKSASDKQIRNKANQEIRNLKIFFSEMANPSDKDYILLKKKESELGEIPLLFDRKEKEEYDKKVIRLASEVEELRKKYKEKQKAVYGDAFEWRFEFPEVLNEDGKFIGFDVVIGNPPYKMIQPHNTSKQEIEYMKTFYPYADFKIDLFHLFFQKSLFLTKNEYYLCLIAPSTLLNNVYAHGLRNYIAANNEILKIVVAQDKVFEDADVHTAIYLFKNTKFYNKNNMVSTTIHLEDVLNGIENYKYLHQNDFSSLPGSVWNLLIDETNKSIINKVKIHKLLGELVKVNRGLITGNRDKYFSNIKASKKHIEILTGSDILRYSYLPPKEYILLKKPTTAGGCWDKEVHLAPFKICIRQIGFEPTATLIELPYAATGNIFTIIHEEKNYLKFLLALLNSKLIKYYWQIMFSDFKSSFPQVTIYSLNQIPIIETLKNKKEYLISLVDKIMSLKKHTPSVDTSDLEKEIDIFVYKLYGLTEEEIKIVENY